MSDRPSRIERRRFLGRAGLTAAGAAAAMTGAPALLGATAPAPPALPQVAGERPEPSAGAKVINPRARVPMSFIIDDSTCLVNLAHFGIPHFHEVFPDRYQQDWRKLPREIPDSFVLEFAAWCREHGIKGKYSVVPYPACVGWVDRDLPGWSLDELRASLKLIREDLSPDWDFHPEMVSHTWVVDPHTGRPHRERSERFMENWRWTDGRSVAELAEYLAFALRILRNAEIPCEGITTPGGFGNRVLPELAQATLESCRDVFNAEIPHYFRHLFTDERSVAPRVEYASGIGTDDPRCVVSIIGCTGDWFGGWDGLTPGSVDRFISADLGSGRLPEVIERGEPAILVCHWPGIYYNGQKLGFEIFKEAVRRVHAKYDNLVWMKLSEIARYWAARELTSIRPTGTGVAFEAPYQCPAFTFEMASSPTRRHPPTQYVGRELRRLRSVDRRLDLIPGTCVLEEGRVVCCVDLPKGSSRVS